MGSEQSSNRPQLTEIKLQTKLIQLEEFVLKAKNKKINEMMEKDQQLRTDCRKSPQEFEIIQYTLVNLVQQYQSIQICNLIIQFIKQLMENVPWICRHQNQNQIELLKDLYPYIETIMWSYQKLGLSQIKDFNELIKVYMGNTFYVQRNNFNLVSQSIKDQYFHEMPQPQFVLKFLDEFLTRYDLVLKDYIKGSGRIPLDMMNQQGFDPQKIPAGPQLYFAQPQLNINNNYPDISQEAQQQKQQKTINFDQQLKDLTPKNIPMNNLYPNNNYPQYQQQPINNNLQGNYPPAQQPNLQQNKQQQFQAPQQNQQQQQPQAFQQQQQPQQFQAQQQGQQQTFQQPYQQQQQQTFQQQTQQQPVQYAQPIEKPLNNNQTPQPYQPNTFNPNQNLSKFLDGLNNQNHFQELIGQQNNNGPAQAQGNFPVNINEFSLDFLDKKPAPK